MCEACATFAVPEGLGEPVVTTPLKPFACGIATLAASGLCADVFHATAPDGCAPIDGEAALRKAIDQQRAAPAPNAPKIAGVLQGVPKGPPTRTLHYSAMCAACCLWTCCAPRREHSCQRRRQGRRLRGGGGEALQMRAPSRPTPCCRLELAKGPRFFT